MSPVRSWEQLLESLPPAVPGRRARLRRFGGILRLYQAAFGPLPLGVKVTGTSGKGSVVAMLEAALIADGKRVGAFTSPHLIEPTERIRIGGVDVSMAELDAAASATAAFFSRVLAELGPDYSPPFFEALLIVALRMWAGRHVEVAVLEVAIGGYNDVVSLIASPLSAITSVGLDHAEELGPSLDAVAADKAGIASDGSVLVLGPSLDPSTRKVVLADTQPRGVRLVEARTDAIAVHSSGLQGHDVQVETADVTVRFVLPLAGDFQLGNLATVVALFAQLRDIGAAKSCRSIAGIARVRWPGRLEWFGGNPAWLVDAAHNELAFLALRSFIQGQLPGKLVTLLYGASDRDNAVRGLEILGPLASEVHGVEGFYKSVSNLPELALHDSSARQPFASVFQSPREAVYFLLDRLRDRPGALVIVAGSLYLSGDCRHELLRSGYSPLKDRM